MFNLLEFWIKRKIKKDSLLWIILSRIKSVIMLKPIIIPIYRKILKDGTFIFEDELDQASLFPVKLLDRAMELFDFKSVLDLGCGTGKSLDYFISYGKEVIGVEGSKTAISKASHPELIMRYNLKKELRLNRKFDLIWSFEFVV